MEQDRRNMKIINNLKKYFETTSKEQVLKDWEECKEFDNTGVKIDDFIKSMELNQIDLNWTLTDEKIYNSPEIKLASLLAGKTKVIAKN